MVMTAIATAIAIPVFADKSDDMAKNKEKLAKAESVLRASLEAPDKGIPQEALAKAECVGVFPDVTKAAFVVGGQGGNGLFTCRDASGKMGPPAFFDIGGGSVGWQFGGQQTDLVLLVMNKGGMQHLLEDKFTLGAEATATAGPVGRTLKAATDAQLNAQILAWSRSQGAFIGAALDGSVIKPDKSRNEAMYGKEANVRAILMDHKVTAPSEATAFIRYLNEHAERSQG
jgi:lipid-binding SYLF domain-containing protein